MMIPHLEEEERNCIPIMEKHFTEEEFMKWMDKEIDEITLLEITRFMPAIEYTISKLHSLFIK